MSEENNYEAYCFKCKTKRVISNQEIVIMKNKMNAVKGTCSVCGGKLFKILPKNKK